MLLEGGYEPLVPWLAQMNVAQFALEYATPRAGRLEALAGLQPGIGLGLGTVNPRTLELESPEWIAGRARTAAQILATCDAADSTRSYTAPERRVFLNPDCGFGTFGDRPITTADGAARKLSALVAAAQMLRNGDA